MQSPEAELNPPQGHLDRTAAIPTQNSLKSSHKCCMWKRDLVNAQGPRDPTQPLPSTGFWAGRGST